MATLECELDTFKILHTDVRAQVSSFESLKSKNEEAKINFEH